MSHRGSGLLARAARQLRAHVRRRDSRQLRAPDAIDLYDEESERATERELAWMWLAGLEERVADLEELAAFFPSLHELRQRAAAPDQRPLWDGDGR